MTVKVRRAQVISLWWALFGLVGNLCWFLLQMKVSYDVHIDIVRLEYLIHIGLFSDNMIRNLDFVVSSANSFGHVK